MADPTSVLSALRVFATDVARDALDAAGSALVEAGSRLQMGAGRPSLVGELRKERDAAVYETKHTAERQDGAVRYLVAAEKAQRARADDREAERQEAAAAIDALISRFCRDPIGDDSDTTLSERLEELGGAIEEAERQASADRQAAARTERDLAWARDELKIVRSSRDELHRELQISSAEVDSALEDLGAQPSSADSTVSDRIADVRNALAEALDAERARRALIVGSARAGWRLSRLLRAERSSLAELAARQAGEIAELRAKLGTRKALVA
jgi:chromosome segregation ATPase